MKHKQKVIFVLEKFATAIRIWTHLVEVRVEVSSFAVEVAAALDWTVPSSDVSVASYVEVVQVDVLTFRGSKNCEQKLSVKRISSKGQFCFKISLNWLQLAKNKLRPNNFETIIFKTQT